MEILIIPNILLGLFAKHIESTFTVLLVLL